MFKSLIVTLGLVLSFSAQADLLNAKFEGKAGNGRHSQFELVTEGEDLSSFHVMIMPSENSRLAGGSFEAKLVPETTDQYDLYRIYHTQTGTVAAEFPTATMTVTQEEKSTRLSLVLFGPAATSVELKEVK